MTRFHRSSCSRWPVGVAAAAVSCATLLLALATPSGAGTTAKLSQLQQGLNYYRGQTITFISPGAVGSGIDVWARITSSYLASYLHATVNVVDIGSNQFPGQDQAAASTPTGLIIWGFTPFTDIAAFAEQQPSINFNPEREAILGALPPVLLVWGTTPSSPYSSLAALRQLSTKANPVKELIPTAGAEDFFSRLFNAAFGVPVSYVPAYPSPTAVEVGFLRGDGPYIGGGPLATFGQAAQGGQLRVIATASTIPAALNETVAAAAPTIAQLTKKFPPKTNGERLAISAINTINAVDVQAVATQGKVPADRVDALRAAVKYAFKNATVQADLAKVGTNFGWIDGSTVKADYLSAQKLASKVAPVLGLVA